MARRPYLVFERPNDKDLSNRSYVIASLAVANLTAAWHHVLRIKGHVKAAESIEQALADTVRLRDSLKK